MSVLNNYVVGLTGGIGSGKTTVADLFAALGVDVVDTDVIARQLTGVAGDAMPSIKKAFGEALLAADGSLNRNQMRSLAFADPEAKRRLEAILHPMIREKSREQCQKKTASPYVMLVVPLLVESGTYRESMNRILLVDCNESLQIERVMQRSALSASQVKAIMDTQATRAERLAVADDVILNDKDVSSLDSRVRALHQQYLALAKQHSHLSGGR